MKKISLMPIYASLLYAFFYLPIILLIVYSFNQSEFSMVWHGFTWKWYDELFEDSSLWIAAWHSFELALTSASLSSAFGVLIAVCLCRYQFTGKKLLNALIFILILSPEIVMGATLLILFSVLHLPLGGLSLFFSHVAFSLPFAAITIHSRLQTIDQNIFESARDLGATDTIILKKIILPLIWPAVLAAWLLCFTLSLDDVIVSYFVSGPEFQILPLKIYSMVKTGIKPEINALCSVLFVFTLMIVLAAQLALRKKIT